MLMIFKSNTDDDEFLDFSSSESGGEQSPGRQLAAAQKQDNNYNEAAKFLYRGTLTKREARDEPGSPEFKLSKKSTFVDKFNLGPALGTKAH